MIFCHPKTQLLTTLPMWQGGPLASFRIFFFFFGLKKKVKVKVKVTRWAKVVKNCVLGWECIISQFLNIHSQSCFLSLD